MPWLKPEFSSNQISRESNKASSERVFLCSRLIRFFSISAVTLCLGGCSWTFLPETASSHKGFNILEDDIQTGSINSSNGETARLKPLKDLNEEDWRRAHAALAVALDPHGSKDRVVWDNPETKLKGNFVSEGPPFVKNDEVCRAFKTTISSHEETRNLQGSACKPSGGEWTIRDIKPVVEAKNSDKTTDDKASKSENSPFKLF